MTGIRLEHGQVKKLGRLLPMEYSPRELTEEIGCSIDQVRRAVKAGLPHRREHNRVWIVGTDFADWCTPETERRPRYELKRNQAWCLSCGEAVVMVGPFEVVPRHGRAELVKGTCLKCGGKVNRLRSRGNV